MNFDRARPIADALLYEGYLLYPYRASALKNRQRFTFGGLLPRDFSEAGGGLESCSLHSECLIEATSQSRLVVRTRFLQLQTPTEAREREVDSGSLSIAALAQTPHRQPFQFDALIGTLDVSADLVAQDVYKLRIEVCNVTPLQSPMPESEARLLAFASTHVVLGVADGAFISLLEPPPAFAALAEGCRSRGAWPVLIGAAGARDLLLCSPIILYDYPQVAPESPGDLFDGTEIDELLRLRILTLTLDEQQEILRGDARGRQILEQTAGLSQDDLIKLHGALRDPRRAAPPTSVTAGDIELRPGAAVRLRPNGRSDVLDLALSGKTATIASIEQDFEGRLFLTVTLDDDPGRDLGMSGQPGHRFFFRPDEVEAC